MLLRRPRVRPATAAAVGAAATAAAACASAHAQLSAGPSTELSEAVLNESERDTVVENWSGTHSANPIHYFQPESADAVQRILTFMHNVGSRLRVMGSALSPNGLGLSDEAMLNMAMCGDIISIDIERRQATVQAGARVSEVVEALRPHGLTLQNYASIAEQQIGGFLQVCQLNFAPRNSP